ncbi:MAG: sulfur carrier protein ThiS [Acidimicrobiales bacterium]
MTSPVSPLAVTLNGEQHQLSPGDSVEDVVVRFVSASVGLAVGLAVALNGTVVPKSSWAATGLEDGDVLEVLTAAQGG